jgi:hypothetical protein
MARSVHIKTPIPSLEEVGKSLGMSKSRQQRLIDIVGSNGRVVSDRSRNMSGSLDGRHRDLVGRVWKKKADTKTTAQRKKSKRASVR